MAGDEEYEIPESGAIYTFGRSRFADNQPSHFFIRNDPIVDISCGDEHTALVCKNGRVFVLGHNDYGQLGLGHTRSTTKPTCVKLLKPYHSRRVACGKAHSLVVAEGYIWAFGNNAEGQLGVGDVTDRAAPVRLDEPTDVVDVAAGCHHSAALTVTGELFVWGSNSDGQCGAEVDQHFLKPVKIIADSAITSMSCGYYHSAYISDGFVFTFGEADNGKLGFPGASKTTNTPQKLELDCVCKLVKCGGNHTIVLSEDGDAFVFGSNFSGQLGLSTQDLECSVPERLQFEHNVKIVECSAGESHSAFITGTGVLLTCGDGRHGKLCNDMENTILSVPTPVSVFEQHFCLSVSCGGCHTMVLAKLRPTELDPDIICSPPKITSLPPLKMKKESSIETEAPPAEETETKTNEDEIILVLEEEKKDEIVEKDEEIDNKSNTESNLNNEEEDHKEIDEIYAEIQEVRSETNGNELQRVDSKEKEPEAEMDVVVEKVSRIKRFFGVFRRKKSVSAILVEENGGKTENSEITEKIEEKLASAVGTQETSRACNIL